MEIKPTNATQWTEHFLRGKQKIFYNIPEDFPYLTHDMLSIRSFFDLSSPVYTLNDKYPWTFTTRIFEAFLVNKPIDVSLYSGFGQYVNKSFNSYKDKENLNYKTFLNHEEGCVDYFYELIWNFKLLNKNHFQDVLLRTKYASDKFILEYPNLKNFEISNLFAMWNF